MINRKELAGVRVDNCNLQEALRKIDIYLNNECMNTVEAISMKTFVAAGENEMVRQCLDMMDMVVPADKEILQELGITDRQWEQEVQESALLYEFLRRIQYGHKSLFLLTDTSERMGYLRDYLKETFGERLYICGSYVFEEYPGDAENVVNEINSVTPHVILSALSTPLQEEFIFEHRLMLNAKIWFGIGAECDLLNQTRSPRRLYRRILVKHKMRRQIQSYETNEKDE